MLAYQTGLSTKCVSERHVYASREKMTAGDAAKLLTKRLGTKVLAKEVKCLYMTHYGHEPEWHHSGFYRGSNGRTMGRTFFLSEEEVQVLADNFAAIRQQLDAECMRKERVVTGFFWTWDYDYGGRYGKRQNFKVLHAYEGSEADKPRNFTACDASLMPAIRANAGRRYYGWNEPSVEEFEL